MLLWDIGRTRCKRAHLVGRTEQEVDKATLTRLQEINRLSDENKKPVYTFPDSFITKTKL